MLALPAAASVELVISFLRDPRGRAGRRAYEGQPRHRVVEVGAPRRRSTRGMECTPSPGSRCSGCRTRGCRRRTLFAPCRVLDEASLRTCEGRFLDLQAQDRLDLGLDDYLEMARLKSGSLAACAARLGALAASADAQVSDALAACGESMGVAWQLSEDVRLFWDLSEDGSNPVSRKCPTR